MHYTVKEIVNILWLPLVIFDVALYVLLKYTSFYAWLLGKAGEFHVKNELKKLPAHYIVLNDIMIATGDKTTQIDHIVVCPSGIFVIETKHYHGMIHGSDNYEYWRQYLGKKRFFQFYNPTRQNYGHILALSNALQLPIEKFTSIVCFTAPVKLNVQSRSQVIYLRDLLSTLTKYQDTIIDHQETIANAIQQLNITDPQARRQHKQSLKVSHSKN